MFAVTAAQQSHLDGSDLALASLFTLTRKDGVTHRFTTHDNLVVFPTGSGPTSSAETFTPGNGLQPTATRSEAALRPTGMDLLGVIDDTVFTDDDLHAGLWIGATVTHRVVDWRFPWLGAIRQNDYTIASIDHGSSGFTLELSSRTSRLARNYGKSYSRLCWNSLGDSGCGVDLAVVDTTLFYGSITEIEDEVTFRVSNSAPSTLLNTRDDGFFAQGLVTFSTGANTGRKFPVRLWFKRTGTSPATSDDAKVVLYFPPTVPAEVGDEFSIVAGCDQRADTCVSKFNNWANFKGFPQIPGTDKLVAKS